MNALDIDPDLWLLSIFAVGLLAAGGAALRSALLHPVGVSSSPAEASSPAERPQSRERESRETPLDSEDESAPPKSSYPAANAVAAPRGEPFLPALDLRTERPRPAEELAAVREELSRSEAAREALRIETVEQRQRSERQAQAARAEIQRLTAELEAEKTRAKENRADLERRLDEIGQALETARAKIEALERLMEGVRARSRELAAELAAAKRA